MAEKKEQEFREGFSVFIEIRGNVYPIPNDDIERLYFIEDIFSFSMTGRLSFYDRHGLVEFGPFTGNEKIVVAYGEKDSVEMRFDIQKVKHDQQDIIDRESEPFIDIYLIDVGFRKFLDREYSFSWKNTKTSQIVDDISKNMVGITKFSQFESSKDVMDYFYMPYWTPKMAIEYLMTKSKGKNSNTTGYLYFTNGNGVNYITLDSLLSQRNLMKVGSSQTPKQIDDDGVYFFKDQGLYLYNKIYQWKISSIDYLGMKSLGGSMTYGYNIDGKQLLRSPNTYTDGVANSTLLGRSSLFPDISQKHISHTLEGDDTLQTLNNYALDDWKKRYTRQHCIIVNVRGNERRYCGGLIEIQWGSMNKEKDIYNKMLEGRYLIKSITHSFSGRRNPYYIQKMVLVKNAYDSIDNTSLVKATNMNIGN